MESSIWETLPVLELAGAALPCLRSNEVPVVPPSEVPYVPGVVTLFPSHQVPRDTFLSLFPSVWRGSHINLLPHWWVASLRDNCILILVLIMDLLTLCPVKEVLFPVRGLSFWGDEEYFLGVPSITTACHVICFGDSISLTPLYSIRKDDLLITNFSPWHLQTHPKLLDPRAVLGITFLKAMCASSGTLWLQS